MRPKVLKGIVAFLSLIVTSGAYAWVSEPGPFAVKSIRTGSGGFYVEFSPAPANCNGGDQYRMHAVVETSNPNYKEMVSMLITAYTAGKKVAYIWISGSGCSTSSILTLEIIEMEP